MTLEEDIEQDVVDWAEARGWLSIKMNIKGNRGYQDRLFISTCGVHVWMEFKKPGEKPRKLQAYRTRELRRRNVAAHWTDSVQEGKEILLSYE